jgi:hypothetical protein
MAKQDTDVPHTVEYYISATSNNGKTITKPMTASQGGYYSFTYNAGSPAFDSTMFDFETASMPMENITFTFGSSWATEDNSDPWQPYTPPTEGIEGADIEGSFGQFYPNPATDRASMVVDLGAGADYQVTIVDQSGRTVHSTSLKAAGQVVFNIETSRLSAGMYTVVFQNGSERVARKLIVK